MASVKPETPRAWSSRRRGSRIETPKASRGWGWGGSTPLPSRLEGVGERHKLPIQRGPGRAPAKNDFTAIYACQNASRCNVC